MSKIFKKENSLPLIVLGSICLIVAILLGVVNMFTAPEIKKNEEQKVYDSLREVLDGYFEPVECPENAPSSIEAIYKVSENNELIGHVITLNQKGYAGDILLTVGIDKDGKITKVVITSQKESHGKDINPLLDRFASVTEDQVADVQHVSGATITSGFIKKAVADAFKVVELVRSENEDNGAEEDIYAHLREILNGAYETVELPENAPSTVKEIYKVTNGESFVGHIVSLNQKGYAGDILLNVGIDKDGKISKVVITEDQESHGQNINNLLNGLASVTKDQVADVQHVSGATITSGFIKKAVADAFKVVELISASGDQENGGDAGEDAYAHLRDILDGTFETIELPENAPSTVKTIYKVTNGENLVGHIVSLEQSGFEDKILLNVGIDKDGKIAKVVITEDQESHGQNINTLLDSFVSVGVDGVSGVDHVSGATYTSGYIKNAVADAFKVLNIESAGDDKPAYTPPQSQREDSELLTLAGELVSNSEGFVEIELDYEGLDLKYLAKLYKDVSGNGYVAYVVSISERYGTVDTENLVYIGNNGKIKEVKKLTWSVSEANPAWGYNPPDEDRLAELYNAFVDKNSDTIGDVDLATGATNTSTILANTIIEALNVVNEAIRFDMPTSEEELQTLISELVGAEVTFTDITPENGNYLKKLYRLNNGEGYIAYVVSISERYGTVDTETLIYVGNNGKIRSVKKLTWSVSEANPDWGYNPPDEDRLAELYNAFVGKNSGTIGDVDLATGATNTSTILANTIIEALAAVENAIKVDMPTPESELEALIAELVGAGVTFTDITPNGYNYIRKLYKLDNGSGYVAYTINFSEKYGNGRLETETLVYVGNNGKIKDLKKITWTNSSASGRYTPPTLELVDAFYESLKGKTLADLEALAALENGNHNGLLVTKATITSKDLLKTLVEALTAVEEAIKAEISALETLIAEMVGEGVKYTDITPESGNYLKKLYRLNNGEGYIAYVVSISERYGTVDTETLIYIGNNGEIKSVKKLTWSVSEANPDWGYNPPSEDRLAELYNAFVGKNSGTIGEVDLATGATNTTTILANTIIEALAAVDEDIEKNRPKTDSEIESLVKEFIGSDVTLTDVTPADSGLVKKLYSLSDGKGYVAYLVAISPNYGTVETETLVHIDNDGKIVAIKNLVWKVSDAVPEWGYNPPSEERVESLYNDFVGKTLDTIGEVDIATGATSTGTRLVECITEALESVKTLAVNNADQGNTSRIIGIVIIAVVVASIAMYIIIPRINKGGKEHE